MNLAVRDSLKLLDIWKCIYFLYYRPIKLSGPSCPHLPYHSTIFIINSRFVAQSVKCSTVTLHVFDFPFFENWSDFNGISKQGIAYWGQIGSFSETRIDWNSRQRCNVDYKILLYKRMCFDPILIVNRQSAISRAF